MQVATEFPKNEAEYRGVNLMSAAVGDRPPCCETLVQGAGSWLAASAHFFQELDLLIHPANNEPYGMVVAEAMAAGVPVIVSDQCGVASDVSTSCGTVLALAEPPKAWALRADKQIRMPIQVSTYSRDWQEVAVEYFDGYNNHT